MRVAPRLLLALVASVACLLGLLVVPAGASVAAAGEPGIVLVAPRGAFPGSVPPEVVQWFGTSALDVLAEVEGPADRELVAVLPLFTWSADFLAGGREAPVLTALPEWMGVVSEDGAPLRLLIAVEAGGGAEPARTELAMTWSDPVLAGHVARLPEGALVVRDSAGEQWFALHEDLITPLTEVPGGLTEATSVPQVQQLLAARQRAMEAQLRDDTDDAWAGVPGLVPDAARGGLAGGGAGGDGGDGGPGSADGSRTLLGGLLLGGVALLAAGLVMARRGISRT